MPTDTTAEPMETGRGDDLRWEDFQVKGEQLLAKVKELVHQGNIRRLVIANKDGRTLVEIPLTVAE